MKRAGRLLTQLAVELLLRELTVRALLRLPRDDRFDIAQAAGLTPAELSATLREIRRLEDDRAEALEQHMEHERKKRRRATTALRLVTRHGQLQPVRTSRTEPGIEGKSIEYTAKLIRDD